MFYEIRANEWMGKGSFSLGLYYRSEAKAKEKCKELNDLINAAIYYVAPIILQDGIE